MWLSSLTITPALLDAKQVRKILPLPFHCHCSFSDLRLTAEFSRLEKRDTSNLREKCQHGWIELAFQARLQRDVRRVFFHNSYFFEHSGCIFLLGCVSLVYCNNGFGVLHIT